MHFLEILGSKSKQQNSKNFNEKAITFREYKSYFIKIVAVLF